MRKLAVERRVNGQNPFCQRRMRGEKIEPRVVSGIGKIQVAGGFGKRRVEPALLVQPADFFECAGDARRIARELHRRRVGQPFAFAANQAFEQSHQG